MCNVANFPQIVAQGVTVTGPVVPDTPVTYMCTDPTMYFINGVTTNQCNGATGVFMDLTPPSCERSKLRCKRIHSVKRLHWICENKIESLDKIS